MREKIKFVVFLGILIALPFSKTYAQENCGGAIVNAKALYDQGKLREAIDGLTPCLTHSLDRTNLWKGYEILALCYLTLNDPVDARKAAENLLELNPQFVPSLIKDPKDFVELINSITVIPKFSLGVAGGAGVNNTYVNVTQQYNVSDFNKNYKSQIGEQFGLILGYNISQNLELGLDLYSSFKNYGISYQTNNFNITDNEHLSYIEIPLYVTYSYGKGRLRPFVTLGGYEDFLLSATSDFSARYNPDNSSYSDNNVNSSDRRNKFNTGLMGGIGLSYKIATWAHVFIDFRYTYGLSNIVNDANRYADQNLIFNYFYLDDNLKISNGLFTGGLVAYLNYKVIRK